jgi:hypothetical protein
MPEELSRRRCAQVLEAVVAAESDEVKTTGLPIADKSGWHGNILLAERLGWE